MQTIVNLVSCRHRHGLGARDGDAAAAPRRRLPPLAGAALQAETSLIWREPALPVVQRFVEQVRDRLATRPKRRQSRLP